ncbi:YqhR family membrane protein [Brevibacillus fulvus]|uniref:Uncharacterized protein n=1 Tax=Brevibacillus fulvus TaxID=1125967 RepID=A0A938XR01_9BACL|nr:YqhR family membrane protein [Brevibacillus fulvus]MBM7588563.1 hypothetical protein [Brevibacillus fulvus]
MMGMVKTKQAKQQKVVTKQLSLQKLLEISFWGTVMWGIVRLLANYFSFTPFTVGSFSRLIYGTTADNSAIGIVTGALILFAVTIVATWLYATLFARIHAWWLGLAYGLVFLLLFALFFRAGTWGDTTMSTEIVWFLSYGLFIGMSVLIEKVDVE